MDTGTKSNTNGKCARANAQNPSLRQTSALQDARFFAASVLLTLLPVLSNPWQSPFWINFKSSELNSTITKNANQD
jgi:hypothetical protein